MGIGTSINGNIPYENGGLMGFNGISWDLPSGKPGVGKCPILGI